MNKLPKFKQCKCGAQLPVKPFIKEPELKIGLADCETCEQAHLVCVGDHDRLMEVIPMVEQHFGQIMGVER